MCTGISRRKAEALVTAGNIKVNGRTIYSLSTKVSPLDDTVLLHNKKISQKQYVYYALNKPVGYTSTTFDPFAQQKVTDLVPKSPKVFPVGRLDKNSEGLIILTNDGDFTNRITHPSTHIAKEYFVSAQVYKKNWTVSDLKRMERGLYIGKSKPERLLRGGPKGDSSEVKDVSEGSRYHKTLPAKITTWNHHGNIIDFHIELSEGRKRQIRKMTHIIGAEVIKLQRVRIGKLKLGNLSSGEYREVQPQDVI